ncbi:RagB/SusD family nutrient uptake outer membrane protein [Flavobacterium tegetincola]|uniref:RagB/SusD family nutrient uptake outer membrane protein n=1 Tax=Flavobacterium tegetincola TaxID=150172 RepID=UPI00047D6A92|nr:RagB/SusD family nutrient uptake outer membrane protein [Flavobacterium tegetincola]
MKKFIKNRLESTVPLYMIVLIGSVWLLSLLSSCDSFTETSMPVTEMNENAVFEDPATATAALTNVYAQVRDAGLLTGKSTGMSKMMGLYSDELSFWGASNDDSDKYYKNTLVPTTGMLREWWNATYTQIYAVNSVLEGLQGSDALEQELKHQLMGEAKVLRAFLHFNLIQIYGAVPYITTTDYTVNSKVKRVAEAEVMDHIIAELEEASDLLNIAYPSEERVRINRYVAQALLARVYLYNGNWGEASNSASAVLNATDTYSSSTTLASTFLKESTATIWQFSPRTATRNTDEGATFIFNSGPPPQVALSESLVLAFEAGDLRKENWIKAVTDGTSTWYHANKYKKVGNSTPQQEYSIVLRLSEQYLIRSEARAQQGELIGAKEDLNVVRLLAGLPSTTAQSKAEILSALIQERRVELFTEYGHRFFDLKRNGLLDAVLSTTKASWNTTDAFLPLPQEELLLNSNLLPQNPGY